MRKLTQLVLLTLTLAASPSLAGEGFSGLQGTELAPVTGLDLGAVLGGLLGDGETGGSLGAVTVSEDAERRLVVEVAYEGLPERQLQGELRGKDRKAQAAFGRPVFTLGAAAGTATLVFEPRDLPEGSEHHSELLTLRVVRAGRPVADLERSYTLRKRWRQPVAPQNVVVRIVPRPEGAAAQLRETIGPKVPMPMPAPRPLPTSPPAARPPQRPATRPMVRAPGQVTASAATARERLAVQAPIQHRTATASLALSRTSLQVKPVRDFTWGLSKEVTDKQGKGPGAATFDLLEGLRADVSLPREALSRISSRVFQDANPASGLFYFLPESYGLRWTAGEGYGLRMLYGAAAAGSEAGEVQMAVQLEAGVDSEEIELALALLRAYQARHPGVKVSELRALPIETPPEVSLAGDLEHQYKIPADRVAVNAISDALGQIDASWSTDSITKENVQLALVEEVGLNGTLLFTPAGEELPPQSIPLRVRLADPATFGRVAWRRGEPWRNPTPYPARLNYLHALLIEGNVPVVYSWNLDGAVVPPQGRAEIDARTVPRWLDGRATRTWLDYSAVGDCTPCDQEVVAAISGGVSSLGASEITIRTITPLADSGAYEIALTVRSRYFDPKAKAVQTKPPLVLTADNTDFKMGPIYLGERPPGQSIPGDPLFEYLLEVSMPDGATHRATRWLAADSLRLLIGKVQVEQALGKLPGGGA